MNRHHSLVSSSPVLLFKSNCHDCQPFLHEQVTQSFPHTYHTLPDMKHRHQHLPRIFFPFSGKKHNSLITRNEASFSKVNLKNFSFTSEHLKSEINRKDYQGKNVKEKTNLCSTELNFLIFLERE